MSNYRTYYELLKDPQWQKKRLEVMERSNFSCSSCGRDNETLNVHHGAYIKGLKPWEYPDNILSCLCETCHGEAEYILDLFRREYGQVCHTDLYYLHRLIEILNEYKSQARGSFSQLSEALACFCTLLNLDLDLLRMASDSVFGKVNDESPEH